MAKPHDTQHHEVGQEQPMITELLGACPRISVIGSLNPAWHIALRVQLGHGL
jgi:hypothetical protein